MNTFLETAKKAARLSGKILMDGFRTRHTLQYKEENHQSITTEIDFKAEAAIGRLIRRTHPDHAILGEENGLMEKSDSPYLWIIDPVDGTTNYSHGIPVFNTTIALQHNGETILGIVYQPVSDEFFVAVRGRGAWRNEKRIHVSKTSALTKGYGFMEWGSRDPVSDRLGITTFASLRRAHISVRNIGSGALSCAYVASGNTDYMIALDSHLWDVAAGMLLITEAGGRVTNFSGKNVKHVWKHDPLVRSPLVCSNGRLHNKLLQFVKNI
jgi:myo-inositol-1(or 4)-monophosphatase